jgi:protein-tyrosine kinase
VGRVFKAMSKAAPGGNLSSPELEDRFRSAGSVSPNGCPNESVGATPVTGGIRSMPNAQAEAGSRSPQKIDHPGGLSGWNERLVAAMGTASPIAEEFRRLRTNVLHPPGLEVPPRTILVASTEPGEGKTFICAALAMTLAQGVEGHALVIDCDLRRPALADMFGLENKKGLTNHLRQGTDLGLLMQKSGLQKLSIIPSGPPPVNPAELLGSEKMAAMISEVANRYPDRYVLFDSPPLRKAAETAILARHVAGIILVVRENKSRRSDVRQLVEVLGPEKFIGVVYNDYHNNLLERTVSGYHDSCYSSYGMERR